MDTESRTDTNMDLWTQVHNTPQQYTKGFKRPGGFNGTAIDPTYLVMRATELWGPIGRDWGYEIVDEAYIQGEPITNVEGEVVGHIIVHKIRLCLTYPSEGAVGHIVQFGQTTFVGRDKNGIYTDEEHAKKSLTDALSKCLSLLGFGADVRIGKFEDSVYAQQREAEEQQKPAAPTMITDQQKGQIDAILKKMGKTWAELAKVIATKAKREIKDMDDLTNDEAVAVIAFLQGQVAKKGAAK